MSIELWRCRRGFATSRIASSRCARTPTCRASQRSSQSGTCSCRCSAIQQPAGTFRLCRSSTLTRRAACRSAGTCRSRARVLDRLQTCCARSRLRCHALRRRCCAACATKCDSRLTHQQACHDHALEAPTSRYSITSRRCAACASCRCSDTPSTRSRPRPLAQPCHLPCSWLS